MNMNMARKALDRARVRSSRRGELRRRGGERRGGEGSSCALTPNAPTYPRARLSRRPPVEANSWLSQGRVNATTSWDKEGSHSSSSTIWRHVLVLQSRQSGKGLRGKGMPPNKGHIESAETKKEARARD